MLKLDQTKSHLEVREMKQNRVNVQAHGLFGHVDYMELKTSTPLDKPRL